MAVVGRLSLAAVTNGLLSCNKLKRMWYISCSSNRRGWVYRPVDYSQSLKDRSKSGNLQSVASKVSATASFRRKGALESCVGDDNRSDLEVVDIVSTLILLVRTHLICSLQMTRAVSCAGVEDRSTDLRTVSNICPGASICLCSEIILPLTLYYDNHQLV